MGLCKLSVLGWVSQKQILRQNLCESDLLGSVSKKNPHRVREWDLEGIVQLSRKSEGHAPSHRGALQTVGTPPGQASGKAAELSPHHPVSHWSGAVGMGVGTRSPQAYRSQSGKSRRGKTQE